MRYVTLPLLILLYLSPSHVRADVDCPEEATTRHYLQQLERRMEKDDVEAALALAEHYHQGGCTDRDLSKSKKIYERLAKEGNAEAEFRLALIYLNGFGVPANKILTEIWLKKAISHGHPSARQLLEYIHEIGFDDC